MFRFFYLGGACLLAFLFVFLVAPGVCVGLLACFLVVLLFPSPSATLLLHNFRARGMLHIGMWRYEGARDMRFPSPLLLIPYTDGDRNAAQRIVK